MPVVAIIGAQWGDEGKGKVVDMLAEKAKMTVRFSGGVNSGLTVVSPSGDVNRHLAASGVFHPGSIAILGNGMVINPPVLIDEMEQLKKRGVDISRLYISDRANLIMPYHTLLDGLEEEARGGKALGTTRKGIGPAYADKVARLGIRVGDLLDKKGLLERLRSVLEPKNAILTKVYGAKPFSLDDIYRDYCRYGDRLAPHIRDTSLMLSEALDKNESILLEGAQGALLDPDFGTYPFTTSSSPLTGGSCLGAGLGPCRLNQALGVFKAYCTRVGSGPMPTELNDEIGESIRERAKEYGTTTGRPRRCGWFDGVAARFSTRINGFTMAAVTRLDVLDILPKLKICVGYRLNGKTIDYFPAGIAALERCEPIYEEMPGWMTPISDIRRHKNLPAEARRYLSRLEEFISCPIGLISVGQERAQTIVLRDVWQD